MNPRRITEALVLGMLLIGLSRLLVACIPLSQSTATVDVQQEIERGVAATLGAKAEIQAAVSATVEAFISGGLPQAGLQDTPQAAAPTATPVPASAQPTPKATSTPLPTAVPVVALPEIVANANTNCRQGPSTNYLIDGYLLAGASSEVYGRTSSYGWWYIKNPTNRSEYCWVWSGSTEVEGEVSAVPVVATTASPVLSSSYGGYYSGTLPKNLWEKLCKKNGSYCNGWYYCQCELIYKNPCKKNNCNPYWNCGGCWNGCPYPYPGPYDCNNSPQTINCYDVCNGDDNCLNQCLSGNLRIHSQ
jgi:hypothetical protein